MLLGSKCLFGTYQLPLMNLSIILFINFLTLYIKLGPCGGPKLLPPLSPTGGVNESHTFGSLFLPDGQWPGEYLAPTGLQAFTLTRTLYFSLPSHWVPEYLTLVLAFSFYYTQSYWKNSFLVPTVKDFLTKKTLYDIRTQLPCKSRVLLIDHLTYDAYRTKTRIVTLCTN